MTESRFKELKEYAQNLCMVQHGGQFIGRMLLELLEDNKRQSELIAVLRMTHDSSSQHH